MHSFVTRYRLLSHRSVLLMFLIAPAIFLSMSMSLFAAEQAGRSKSDKEWQVERPESATRSINIDVTEGTWMSLDVSPDGKSIVFDLLGDIYELSLIHI